MQYQQATHEGKTGDFLAREHHQALADLQGRHSCEEEEDCHNAVSDGQQGERVWVGANLSSAPWK